MTLDELKNKRQKFVESARENNFEEGLKNLLSQLYPDNAHFIYELLQNSEDANASAVEFLLKVDGLEFKHNGKKLFSLQDIESITSIGKSTKVDDPTSIGKFGVGFKAIFSYTKTPEIHSGKYSFCIRDLFVPDTNIKKKYFNDEDWTHFFFPFDNPSKSSKQAVEEIERGLKSLQDNTLLFLRNIRRIDYTTSIGENGFIERTDLDEELIQISSIHPGIEIKETNWLRLYKDINILNELNDPVNCRIAIAYSLIKDQSGKKNEKWKIVPLEKGDVSIFFPAEKERSDLRFHIHAPFASTVARDSVRDVVENEMLLSNISDLVVESVQIIKNKNLLGMSFLAVMPNNNDNLSKFYIQIRDSVVKAFQEKEFTPSKNGLYVPSNTLFRGPSKITSVISDEDLSILTNKKTALWALHFSEKNLRERHFLDTLKIREWSWEDLVGSLHNYLPNVESQVLEAWISNKKDEWLVKYYGLLGEACDSSINGYYFLNRQLKIIRVISKSGVEHVCPNDSYFPEANIENKYHGLNFLKPESFKSNNENNNKFAYSFLQQYGVKTFDEKAIIELKLEKYAHNHEPCKMNDSYFQDLLEFIDFLLANPEQKNIFRSYKFLIGIDRNTESIKWSFARSLCIDEPFLKTGLSNFSEIHKKITLWPEYSLKFDKKTLDKFINFLNILDLMQELRVEKTTISNNPVRLKLDNQYGRRTSNEINIDYTIQNIEAYLSTGLESASLLIWNAVINADAVCSIAQYRPNSECHIRKEDSQLVSYLRGSSWIPSKKSNLFLKPQEASHDDLYDSFVYNNKNGILTAIGFGELSEKNDKEFKAKEEVAKSIGYSSMDEAVRLVKVLDSGVTIEEIEEYAKNKALIDFPSSNIPNPEFRKNRIYEVIDQDPNKESKMVQRSVDPNAKNEINEARTYLKTLYTNLDGFMLCQCCKNTMPFKVNDEYYFEAIQCFAKIPKHHKANRMALCPNCAAMFINALDTKEEVIGQQILKLEITKSTFSESIFLKMDKREFNIKFVGQHIFDLQLILTKYDF